MMPRWGINGNPGPPLNPPDDSVVPFECHDCGRIVTDESEYGGRRPDCCSHSPICTECAAQEVA